MYTLGKVDGFEGNTKAQKLVRQVFDVADGRWRGLGKLPKAALTLKNEFEIMMHGKSMT